MIIALYGIVIGVYLGIGLLVSKNVVEEVRSSKEYIEEYKSNFDYYFDMTLFTLIWLPLCIYEVFIKK